MLLWGGTGFRGSSGGAWLAAVAGIPVQPVVDKGPELAVLRVRLQKPSAFACCISGVMRVCICKICFKKPRMGPGGAGQCLPVVPKCNCLLSKSNCGSKAQVDFITLVLLQGRDAKY